MNTADRQVIDMVNRQWNREQNMARMAKLARWRKEQRRQERERKRHRRANVIYVLVCVALASEVAILALGLSILAVTA